MKILGINAFHADSSAALLCDGHYLVAAEEERFRRIKHWAGFPAMAIEWCLSDAGISISDIDHIAINTDPSAHKFRKLLYTLSKRPSPKFLFNRWKNKRERSGLIDNLRQSFPLTEIRAQTHFVEHHRSHLASAFYASQFSEACVVSVDGFGDFASTAWGLGTDKDLSMDGQIYFPHSLGVFYTSITQYLGFPNYGDEYKVMGLAPYGKPIYLNKMRNILRLHSDGSYSLALQYFTHASGRIAHQWSNGAPSVGVHFNTSLCDLLGPNRLSSQPLTQFHFDIASSAQAMYEEAFFHLLNSLHSIYQVPNLCIAGGCGANSVANGKIARATPFNQIYVQSAAGDAGGALGSALHVWHQLDGSRHIPMGSAYLGVKASPNEINDLLAEDSVSSALQSDLFSIHRLGDHNFPDEASFLNEIATYIADGQVIGWFYGRMEWGPRALGHRSILCDPRRSDMKDILNHKIKRRESFRPFAPSVLKEFAQDWFDFPSLIDTDVPYMMKVFPVRESKRKIIPSVTHVDGSGRLQTVTELQNDRYYRLINTFHSITSVPILLNTSFNENEPIVSSPREALDCFLRTKMDVLVLEDILIKRL